MLETRKSAATSPFTLLHDFPTLCFSGGEKVGKVGKNLPSHHSLSPLGEAGGGW